MQLRYQQISQGMLAFLPQGYRYGMNLMTHCKSNWPLPSMRKFPNLLRRNTRSHIVALPPSALSFRYGRML